MTRYTITREDAYGFKTVRHADTAQGAALMHSLLESLPGTLTVTTHDPEDRVTSGTVVGDGPERPDAKVSSASDQQLASAMDGVYVKPPSALDVQVGGDHYKKLKIQPMEYSMANKLDACQHTIIKYVTRFRDKGGIADLEKAKHVIDLLIELEQRKETTT